METWKNQIRSNASMKRVKHEGCTKETWMVSWMNNLGKVWLVCDLNNIVLKKKIWLSALECKSGESLWMIELVSNL
jgi:hypothetical protein